MRKTVHAEQGAPAKGPYSHGVISQGRQLFVSGQGPVDPATGEFTGDTFEEQAVRTFENLKAIVEASGASMKDVVKVNAYLSNMGDFAKFNEIYKRYFDAPYPARTTVPVPLVGFMIEIDCIVQLPE